MRVVKQSTAANVMIFLTAASDHISGLAGASLTINASKDGAAFAAITPTVTDRGNGWYNLALTTAHTDTLGDLALRITAASADPTDMLIRVVARPFDDLAFPAVAGRSIQVETDGMVHGDLKEWLGVAPLALAAQRVVAQAAAMTAGLITATEAPNLDAAVSSRAAGAALTTHDTDIKARLPAALVGGRMDSSVGAMASGVLTAAAIAASALNGKGDWSLVGSQMNLTDGAITAAKIAAGALNGKGDWAVTGAAMALTAAAVDDVWDEVLSPHNVANSAAVYLKNVASGVMFQGTAAGGGNTYIDFPAGASSQDDLYAGELVAITAGPGAGQSRLVVTYVGGGTKRAYVNRAWHINPTAASEFSVIAVSAPLRVQDGLAQGGGSNYIDLSAGASTSDDLYNGMKVVIYAGAGEGQSRIIEDYTGSSRRCSVKAWVTNPDATSIYAVLPVGRSWVSFMDADSVTAAALAADAGTEIATAVWAAGARTLTALGFQLGSADYAAGFLTAALIAADAIGASELADDAAQEIAVKVLTIASSVWEASAAPKSLGAAVMKAVHRTEDDGVGNIDIYRSDGSTLHATQAITTDSGLQPIKGLGGAT